MVNGDRKENGHKDRILIQEKGASITLCTEIRGPIDVVFNCARSIEIHQLSTAATNEMVIGGKASGLCELGDEVTWRAKHFWIYQTLTSRITLMNAPHYFQDCMVKGAFSFFKHDHYFEVHNGVTYMSDNFRYGVPYGMLGRLFDALILKKYMSKLLTDRNLVIKKIAENDKSFF